MRRTMRLAVSLLITLGLTTSAGAQTIGLPLPSIGLPLPELGLPLPSTGLPPQTTSQPPPRPSSPEAEQRTGHAHPPRGTTTVVYFVPVGWPYSGAALPGPPPAPTATAAPAPPPATSPVVPEQQQFAPQLPAAASAPAGPPPPPSTIYLIPGCYLGNLPPREVTLPAGCDPARAVMFPSSK